MQRLRFVLFAVLAMLPLLPAPARAWWNGDWPYRMKIDADLGPHGGNIAEAVGRTRILVRLHSGNFNFATLKDDGSDLRFVGSDDKTPLHFQVARFDPLIDQVALVWVDVPDLAANAVTPLYLYWGNKNALPGADPHATFDADTVLAYLFGDDSGVPKDATANGLDATSGAKRSDAGITGFALKLDGSDPVRLPQSPLLALAAGQPATWQMWVQQDPGHDTATLFSVADAAASFEIGTDHGVAYAAVGQGGAVQRSGGGGAMTPGAWHLLSVVAEPAKISVYVDGRPAGVLGAALPAIAGAAVLGGSAVPPPAPAPSPPVAATAPDASSPAAGAPPAAAPAPAPLAVNQNFVGLLDDFTYARVARPLGAIQLAADVDGPQANVLSFEKPEESSFFGSGYIGIILKSVTPDAWVVIGILGVMAVISWGVMVAKAIYVGSLGRANRVFREGFLDSASPDGGERLGNWPEARRPVLQRSSLFRLYRIGGEELARRVSRGRLVAGAPVPPQSLAAIRSSLDAAYVRESRRLNGLMVLLTIAIAGGPFIGLLGTVIGVMITFAAIAAAGDVNVNAIAPGISAALLATVAGLAVAIPALFGYNYFTVKIRDASSEMQVFIEELLARIGEGAAPSDAGGTQPAAAE